jgi:hypothetical protein
MYFPQEEQVQRAPWATVHVKYSAQSAVAVRPRIVCAWLYRSSPTTPIVGWGDGTAKGLSLHPPHLPGTFCAKFNSHRDSKFEATHARQRQPRKKAAFYSHDWSGLIKRASSLVLLSVSEMMVVWCWI